MANNLTYSVTVYDKGTGVLKRRIAGSNTQIDRPTGIAIDEVNAELYVANDFGDSITVYERTAEGNAAPKRTLAGSATGLVGPVGLAVDPAHNELFVSNYRADDAGSITVYGRTASGNTAPIRTIQGSATGLDAPQGLGLDPLHGEIFVATAPTPRPTPARFWCSTGATPAMWRRSGGSKAPTPVCATRSGWR